MTDVSLACTCGKLRGTARDVSPGNGVRLICICDDCQAYARFLGRAGDVLDSHGGSDIFQLTPAQLTFTSGTEHLRCVKLSDKGMHRWYADCCKTPVANTLGARIPFAGIPQPLMQHAGPDRDAATGRPVKIHARFALGAPPADAHPRAPLSLIPRILKRMILGALRGKHRPSPFFDGAGRPVAEPTVLSAAQRAALRSA